MGRVINANDIFIHPLKTIAKMKKILFAIMALAISTCAFAQGQRREFKPEDMAKRQADRIKETCKTNEKQDKALYGYFLRQAKRQQEEWAKMQQGERPQGNREDFRAEMEKRQKAQNDTLKTILTKEQFATYEKSMQEMRNRGPRGGQGGQGGPRGDRPQRNN